MSKSKVHVLKYDIVNRVNQENVEEFPDSLFFSEFEKASFLVNGIIEGNERIRKSPQKDSNQIEEICNIISFLGGRGTGKSSAMLSYSNIFKEFCNELKVNPEYRAFFPGELQGDLSFLMLDSIDASLLGNNEGVLEVVLAKMWDYFEQYSARNFREERGVERDNVMRRLTDLKNDYANYVKMNSQERMAGSRQLHQLAGSLILRSTFYNCVDAFLKHFSKQYLVLVLDDIDLAGKNSYNILQQLHQFFCIPGIIILVTADVTRLNQICGNYYLDTYAPNEFCRNDEYLLQSQLKEEFVNDYLEKIIPSNMRIMMPDIYSYDLVVQTKETRKDAIDRDCSLPKAILFPLFAAGLPFDIGSGKNHFWVGNTLRVVVNRLYALVETGENEDKQEHVEEWVVTGLRDRLLKRVPLNQRERLERIFRIEPYELNHYVIEIILEEIRHFMLPRTLGTSGQYYGDLVSPGFTLGDVLNTCNILENYSLLYVDFINFILAYYTVVHYQSDVSVRREVFGQALWGNWINRMIFDQSGNGVNLFAGGNRGIFLDRVALELEVQAEELEQCMNWKNSVCIVNKVGLSQYCNTLLEQNRQEIMAFQVVMTLFYNRMVRDGESLFDFSYGIHNAKSKKKVSLAHDKRNEETGSGNGNDETLAEGSVEPEEDSTEEITSYKIIIKSKPGIRVQMGLDFSLLSTSFADAMLGNFEKQFIPKVKEQVDEIVKERVDARNYHMRRTRGPKNEVWVDGIFLNTQLQQWKKAMAEKMGIDVTNAEVWITPLPIENVQLIYNLGKAIGSSEMLYNGENLHSIIRQIYGIIGQELKQREEYYAQCSEGKQCCYFENFCKYPVVAFWIDVSEEKQKAIQKMVNQAIRNDAVGMNKKD